MDEDDRSKTDQFYLRIGDVCEHDTLTKNAEFADWTYIIWSTKTTETKIPDYTQKNNLRGTCPLTAKLYFWNEGTQVWDDSATTWSAYTANSNFITTNSNPTAGVTSDSGTMSVHFQSPTTAPAVKPFLDILVKITLEDERADNDCSATVNQQGPNTACTLNQAKLEWQFTL